MSFLEDAGTKAREKKGSRVEYMKMTLMYSVSGGVDLHESMLISTGPRIFYPTTLFIQYRVACKFYMTPSLSFMHFKIRATVNGKFITSIFFYHFDKI